MVAIIIPGRNGPMVIGGTSGGAAANTFNPSDKRTNGVLSNANLTFKNNNGSDARIGVRSVNGHTVAGGGKWYFEKLNDTALSGAATFGITPNTQAFSSYTFNGAGGSGAGFTLDGAAYVNGSIIGGSVWNGGTGSGEWSAFAINFVNMKAWAYSGFTGQWNADVIANQNPATNTGGMDISALAADTYYATVQLSADQSIITANFGPSFHFTPPSGFSAF